MGSATSNIVFYRSGNLDLKSAFKLVPLTFIGSIIGIVHLMNPEVLKPLMLIMLGAVAIYTIFKKDWGSISTHKKLSGRHVIIFTFFVLLLVL